MKLVIYISALLFLLTDAEDTYAQKTLDSLDVYNVYCTIVRNDPLSGGVVWMKSWAGNYTNFYPTEECPEPVDKYIQNLKLVSKYMRKRKFFWLKLYNTSDQLIYESLKYGDCTLGPFICYYPNGNIKLRGQNDGYKLKKNGSYKKTKCSGKPVGTWHYYDNQGNIEKTEKH